MPSLTKILIVLLAFAWAETPLVGQDTPDQPTKAKTESKAADTKQESDQAQAKKKAKQKAAKASKQDKQKKKPAAKEKPSKAKEDPPEEKKAKLRVVALSGYYVDLVQPMTFDPMSLLMGSAPVKQRSFYRLCQFIDDLAKDKRYDYVAFDLSNAGLQMNPAQLDELARRMKKLKAANKKTFAWLESASNVHLSIAANCDEVLMANLGGVDMPSLAMQSMFYRDAMDLLGVKASVVRAGDFKGAVEPYLNSKMSDHLRAHYMDMLETMNDAQVARIARGRGLKNSKVRELQKQRLLVPKEALAAGLVDQLAPYGAMRASIEKAIDEPIEWVTAKTAAQKQVSLFQLMGQMMAGPTPGGGRIRDNTIAVIHLAGVIVDGKKHAAGNIVSGPTVSLLASLEKDDKVKGAVIRINSPGGSATASEAIRQGLAKLSKAKPTVISMGNVAASGGYWVSCIDAPVYAERGTLTGSIGVFSMKLSAGALMRRIGVQLEAITLDDAAATFSLDRPWSETDSKTLQKTIDMFYGRFLKLVGKSRGMSLEKVEKLAGGRVWSGTQAKRHKLVDEVGGLDDCVAAVAKKAKLDDFHLVHRPVPRIGLNLADLLGQGGEEEILTNVPATALQLLRQRGLSLDVTRTLLRDALSRQGRPTVWLLNPIEVSIR